MNWITLLASEFIEGCADAFLVACGGAAGAAALSNATNAITLTPRQIASSMLIGGAWYAASFVKKSAADFRQSIAPLPAQPAPAGAAGQTPGGEHAATVPPLQK